MKCVLGPKKTKQLSVLLGRPVAAAAVRGGWDHDTVEVWFPEDPEEGPDVVVRHYNRRTGELINEWFPNRR